MEFPDFSLTFLVFKISLTNLQNSLTLKKNQISLTFPWPVAIFFGLLNIVPPPPTEPASRLHILSVLQLGFEKGRAQQDKRALL